MAIHLNLCRHLYDCIFGIVLLCSSQVELQNVQYRDAKRDLSTTLDLAVKKLFILRPQDYNHQMIRMHEQTEYGNKI